MNNETFAENISENDFTFLAIDNSKRYFKKKCVVVQTGYVHEEIIPSIVYFLNLLDFDVDIYLNQRSVLEKGNIFNFFKKISYRLFLVNFGRKPSWKRLMSDVINGGEYDLLVSNTFQLPSVCNWISQTQIPMIGIVHNVDLFLRKREGINSILNIPKASPIFLAEHIYDYAINKDNFFKKLTPRDGFVYPIYFENLEAQCVVREDKRDEYSKRFIVQGTISYTKRDYPSLVSAIYKIAKEGIKDSEINIVINGNGKDKDRLLNEIQSIGIQDYFNILANSENRILYSTYYDELLASDFLLPLVSNQHPGFLSSKMSSSLMIAIGMKIVPIISSFLSQTYGIREIKYHNEKLEEGILKALNLSPSEHTRLQLGLKSQSLLLLHKSVENIENTIQTVMS